MSVSDLYINDVLYKSLLYPILQQSDQSLVQLFTVTKLLLVIVQKNWLKYHMECLETSLRH